MEATNFHETGLETTVVATVRYRFLLYNTNLDVFSDFTASEPTIDWRSTLSWRLTPELSLDYAADSAAAHRRRLRSSNTGATALYFPTMVASNSTSRLMPRL